MSDENPCLDCEAVCCSFRESKIGFTTLSKGQRYDSMFIEYVETRPHSLVTATGGVPDMRWFVWDVPDDDRRQVFFDCGHLTDGGLCGVYDDRPGMCRAFECDVLKGETTLEEWNEEQQWDGPPESELTEVTGRVREIIAQRGVAP